MNEQQEKRKRIQRAKKHDDDDDRSKLDPIPLDLIPEILSRLAAKSIVRCQCVSKVWSSLTKHQSFINSFATRSCERPPRILLIFSTYSKRFVFSVPQGQNPDGSSSPVDSYQMTNPQYWSYPISECVQGLVLFNGLVIWNPAMSRFLNLPKPKTGNGRMSFLGYDPLEGKHKVVHVDHTTHARVLTLGAQESWRTITKGSPSQSWWRPDEEGGGGRCFNGILYFSARFGAHLQQIIMSFDVGSEKFNSIKRPEGYRSFDFHLMIPYEGRLALVNSPHISRNKFDLWTLKDADGREWTHKRFRVPSHRDKTEMSTRLYFKGVTDAGELMFAPLWSESFYILYFDPRRNSIREALFEGIVGDGFRRRYGLGKHDIRQFHIFPNHMEILVPSL